MVIPGDRIADDGKFDEIRESFQFFQIANFLNAIHAQVQALQTGEREEGWGSGGNMREGKRHKTMISRCEDCRIQLGQIVLQ